MYNNKKVLFLFVLLTIFSCKEAVRNDSTLVETSTADSNDSAIVQKDSISDGAYDVSEVNTAPEMLVAAKPIYSMEMIDGQVEGTVKIKLLIDTDGYVKKHIILNDLGHGTNEAIEKAVKKMEFTAARKDGKRVPVWIETTLNFTPPKLQLE